MSKLQPGLDARYSAVRKKLLEAEKAVGKADEDVFLLPVSKTFGLEAMEEAVACGMRAFGENYVQEACEKIDYFREHRPELRLTWHLIGPLQSNKTRPVAERFDWVQTVDRLKIAERLSAQRPASMPPLNVLIEVHISGEESKSGAAPEEVRALAEAITELPNLKLRGLMAIPAPAESEEEQLKPLKAMRKLFDELKEAGFDIDTLSMGMSADMEAAVKAGSTMVRVGSAIFGARDYSKK